MIGEDLVGTVAARTATEVSSEHVSQMQKVNELMNES